MQGVLVRVGRSWSTPVLVSGLIALGFHVLAPGTSREGDNLTYSGIASGLVGFEDPVVPFADLSWAIGGLAVRGYVYPLFVGAVYFVTGGINPSAVEAAQALIFLPLTTLLLYLAGREAFSASVGLIAAWCFALWFPATWHTIWLLTEPMLACFIALLLFLLARMLSDADTTTFAFLPGLARV